MPDPATRAHHHHDLDREDVARLDTQESREERYASAPDGNTVTVRDAVVKAVRR